MRDSGDIEICPKCGEKMEQINDDELYSYKFDSKKAKLSETGSKHNPINKLSEAEPEAESEAGAGQEEDSDSKQGSDPVNEFFKKFSDKENRNVIFLVVGIAVVVIALLLSSANEGKNDAMKQLAKVQLQLDSERAELEKLKKEVAETAKVAAAEKEKEEIKKKKLKIIDNIYPRYLDENENYPLMAGHMGLGIYLDKTTIRIEETDGVNGQEGNYVIISMYGYYVDNFEPNYADKPKRIKGVQKRFRYDLNYRVIYIQKDGVWTSVNPKGGMVETRGVTDFAEAAYYILYGKRFFREKVFPDSFYEDLNI